MKGVREHFTNFTKSGLDLKVMLGDDTTVKAVGRGTVTL